MAAIKLVNPLHYPLAVLAGGIVLIAGIRVMRGSPLLIMPVAAAIAVGGAAWRHSQLPEPEPPKPVLDQELQAIQRQAQTLQAQTDTLRVEAKRLLADSPRVDLLGAVEYACDRAQELPQKVNALVYRLAGADSILSAHEIQQQLVKARQKQAQSQGSAQRQWDKLAASLERNLELIKQGKDAREAQIINLSTLLSDAAGVLQQLQTNLRSANLDSSIDATELQALSEEFNRYQENVDLLLS